MPDFNSPLHAAQWLQEHVRGTLQTDSRTLQAGDGFVAWPGTVVDARKYVAQAISRGASACLVEQQGSELFGLHTSNVGRYPGLKADTGLIASAFFDNPSHHLALVAVTGTNGKTSSTWWLAQALSKLPHPLTMPCGVIGTLGVGQPHTQVTANGMTTPDPVVLQHTLRQCLDAGLKACAIEASSIGIEEQRLQGTRVQVAVFTNFTQDHLDYHGSMEAYWQAKRKLFAWPGLQSAVINIDDGHGAEMAQALSQQALDVWTVSCHEPARLRAQQIAYRNGGLHFVVHEGASAVGLQTRMIGSYNVSNLLGVLAAMRALGVPLQAAVDACSHLSAVPGRMECLGGAHAPLVAVDYAHTPDALAKALDALRPLAQERGGRLWCVFGCGGDRDASKRPIMGAIAMQHADSVVITSDNPRSEKPESIISQILLGLVEQTAAQVWVDRAQAIAAAVAQAAAQDVILLAGKGHETMQEIAGVKHPFSDFDHAQKALALRLQPAAGGTA